MNRLGHLIICGVLLVALLGSGYARNLCLQQRRNFDVKRSQTASGGGDVSQLSSFALGLLLGGLRGPMLMALWTSSENQKSDRNLDDFDTKVELIRLLQAEFDGVHLFQIWNKAYNISVQMANVPTKYITILDAMDYAYNVDKQRPDNINIISAIAGLYLDKLGGASEKVYYRPRLMDETLPVQDRVRVEFPANQRDLVLRQARLVGASTYALSPREANNDGSRFYILLRKPIADLLQPRLKDSQISFIPRPVKTSGAASSSGPGRRIEHDSLLDQDYNILPQYTAPREGLTATGDGADGSQLPYLRQYQPYPLGVSPYALAFNYYKRAQWLQKNRGVRHAQLSDRVVASRPALALKRWSEEDWYDARRAEIELFGLPVPREESELEAPTQSVPLNQSIEITPLLEQIIYRYQNAAHIADAAVLEYKDHFRADNFPVDALSYASHVESSEAQAKLMRGDYLYLQAMIAAGPQKIELAKQAFDNYRQAASLYARHIFKFYTADEDAYAVLPSGVSRADVSDPKRLSDALLPLYLARLHARHIAGNYRISNSEDFKEINNYVLRANARMTNIAAILK